MTYEALQANLAEAKQLLVDNEQVVTVDRLAAIKKVVDLFKMHRLGSPVGIFSEVEAMDIVQTLESLIAHEEALQGGLADSLIASITKIQGRPLEMRAIALFL